MVSERIAILVDGSNLYHYLRELKLTNLSEFNYKAFAHFLGHGRRITSSTYYIGFAHRPSFGLMKNVDLTTTLRCEDLAGFINKKS